MAKVREEVFCINFSDLDFETLAPFSKKMEKVFEECGMQDKRDLHFKTSSIDEEKFHSVS